MRTSITVALLLALAGCARDVKEPPPDPVVSAMPKDAPPQDDEAPPLGKPRAKVPPSAANVEKRSESLLKDDPH